jgi:hypothetical protein
MRPQPIANAAPTLAAYQLTGCMKRAAVELGYRVCCTPAKTHIFIVYELIGYTTQRWHSLKYAKVPSRRAY